MAGILSAGMLGAIEQRTFFEKLLLPGDPGTPVDTMTAIIYSVAIVAVVFLPFISVVAMFSIWAEQKVAGHIQSRLGPNRVRSEERRVGKEGRSRWSPYH